MVSDDFNGKIVGIKMVMEEKENKEIQNKVIINFETISGTKICITKEGNDIEGYKINDPLTISVKRLQTTLTESTKQNV